MPEPATTISSDNANDVAGAIHHRVQLIGALLVDTFHYLGLFAIGAATAWAAVVAFLAMAGKGHASIEDLLLLFIYLEIGAMVGIYFKTNHMPVRFLIYVAITAITRHLVGFVNASHKPDLDILIHSGAILVLALAVLTIRYGSSRLGGKPGRADVGES